MSKKPPASTVKGISSLLKTGEQGEYSAGDGLYLSVNGTNAGSWIYRYQINGRRRRIGLGVATVIALTEARHQVAKQKALIAQGIDPLEHKARLEQQRVSSSTTFDMVAADYIEAQRDSWTNAKHAQQWVNTLTTYASPVIGALPPSEITTDHILAILQPIWNTKTETARRVRNRIELVLNAAKARKLRTGENVAAWRGHLELLLTNHKKSEVRHHPALSWRDIKPFWFEISEDRDIGGQALQLTILTALRTNEVLGAHWSEIDLENKVWTVSAKRMKTKKEHRVPLSNAAIKILQTILQVDSGLLFEGRMQGKPIANMTMLMKCRRMDEKKYSLDGIGWRDEQGERITPHGFRSTFRDWAAENTAFENIVVEQALAHSINNAVEAAYRRGDLLERRRQLMEAWGDYVTQEAQDNVIQLHPSNKVEA